MPGVTHRNRNRMLHSNNVNRNAEEKACARELLELQQQQEQQQQQHFQVQNVKIWGLQLRWRSEYRTSLVFEWLKIGRMPNVLDFECHLNTEQPNHLNTGLTNGRHLVFLCTGPEFKWLV